MTHLSIALSLARTPSRHALRGVRGFTMVELMITVAIVGVLAAVALPAYFQYVKRATYAELLAQAAPVKTALVTCITIERNVANCSTFSDLGVAPPAPTKVVKSVDLVPSGADLLVRLVPNDYRGIDAADTCDLVPIIRRPPRAGGGSGDPTIEGWAFDTSSPCVVKGYVKN